MGSIRLKIDDKDVTVQHGATILQAAQSVGIPIPVMCWHPRLDPIGSCRVCLVEVDGADRLVASCNTPAQEGMCVVTNSDRVNKERQKALALALVDHPLDCGMCDKSGECDLQDRTVELGIEHPLFPSVGTQRPYDELSPLIELCLTRCICCSRCIQICQQIQGARAIDYRQQGGMTTLIGRTLDDGYSCESCGQCITVCPCGVILDRTFKHRARPWELEKALSACPYCGDGCSLLAHRKGEAIFRVTPQLNGGINDSLLCVKGRFAWDVTRSATRLTQAAIRDGETQRSVSLQQAAQEIAKRVEQTRREHGDQAIAVLAGAPLSNEDIYQLGEFAKHVLGTSRISDTGTLWNLGVPELLLQQYGYAASPADRDSIAEADAILVLDANIVNSHPVVSLALLKAKKEETARIIVTGYRTNKLTRSSSVFVRSAPESDLPLLLGLIRHLLAEGRSGTGIDERQLTEIQQAVDDWTADAVACISGAVESTVRHAWEIMAQAKQPLIVLASSRLDQFFDSRRLQAAVIALRLLGRPDRLLVLGNPHNVQGAWDMGFLARITPGHVPAADPAGDSLDSLLTDLFTGNIPLAISVNVDWPLILASLGLPDSAMQKIPDLIALETFPGTSAKSANITIPIPALLESAGTFTTSDRYVNYYRQILQPPTGVFPISHILNEVAQAMGFESADLSGKATLQLLSNLNGPYHGISKQLARGFQWQPDPALHQPSDNFDPAAGLKDACPKPDPSGITLVIEQRLEEGSAGSRYSRNLDPVRRVGIVEISQELASELGLSQGQTVTLSGRDSVSATVSISPELLGRIAALGLDDWNLWRPLLFSNQSPAPDFTVCGKIGKITISGNR